MTPRKKGGGQSRRGSAALASGRGRAARSRKRKRTESTRSRIFLNFLSHRIPVYPISDFLLPLEPVERFLKEAGAFRVELKSGHRAYQHPGDARPLIFVERGLVELSFARTELGCVRNVEPGFVFGEAPLLGMNTFAAEAVAKEESCIFLMDPKSVEDIVWGSPELSRRWGMRAFQRCGSAERNYLMAIFAPVEVRVAALLSELARPGEFVRAGQEELASRLGVHRETVSVALSRLKRQGLVGVRRRAIEILNRNMLADLSAPFTSGRLT